jgi:hypothetical protein
LDIRVRGSNRSMDQARAGAVARDVAAARLAGRWERVAGEGNFAAMGYVFFIV